VLGGVYMTELTMMRVAFYRTPNNFVPQAVAQWEDLRKVLEMPIIESGEEALAFRSGNDKP